MTPEELRKEANATEFMAALVSYGRDKDWLKAKAAQLRHQADLMEQRSWDPRASGTAASGVRRIAKST